MSKTGRNDLCPCDSGKKYKKCCLRKDTKKQIPMKIEDAEKCREYYRIHPEAGPEFAEKFRITPNPVAVDRCREICENFDTCLLALSEPNNPPECTDFYNDDMYKQFYESKDEILEHIKSFGFIPKITDESKELVDKEDEDKGNISILDIDLCLNDESTLFTRLYEKRKNEPWEFVSQDCPRIGIGGSRDIMKNIMRTYNDEEETDIVHDPDFNDPFAPNQDSEKIVKCLHCGDKYKEKEIKWSNIADMWVCKNYPKCNGAGLGFDIHYSK